MNRTMLRGLQGLLTAFALGAFSCSALAAPDKIFSLAFNPGEVRDGKQHKLLVKVDVDGDGTYDDKEFVVQARQFYHSPKPEGAKK